MRVNEAPVTQRPALPQQGGRNLKFELKFKFENCIQNSKCKLEFEFEFELFKSNQFENGSNQISLKLICIISELKKPLRFP